MDIFNGTWQLEEIPEDFFKILKILGYNGIERKYIKKNKLKIISQIEDNILVIRFESPLYKTEKKYPLNGEPVEYVDDRKNSILEVAHWLDETSIHIKTMYLEKGLTILNTKTLKNNECHHHLKLVSIDHPEIDVNLVYLHH